jgi:hypothetical protein
MFPSIIRNQSQTQRVFFLKGSDGIPKHDSHVKEDEIGHEFEYFYVFWSPDDRKYRFTMIPIIPCCVRFPCYFETTEELRPEMHVYFYEIFLLINFSVECRITD